MNEQQRLARIDRLKTDPQFGHAGRHHGNGTPDCPRELHHHHDIFCPMPTPAELHAAGVAASEVRSRA